MSTQTKREERSTGERSEANETVENKSALRGQDADHGIHRQIKPEAAFVHGPGPGVPASQSHLQVNKLSVCLSTLITQSGFVKGKNSSRTLRVYHFKIASSASNKFVSRLSSNLTRRIEEYDNPERRDMVSGVINGCAPLFLACKNGSADVVDYLVTR